MVLARSIPVRSVCEHHLLPFVGTAHVGYLPGHRILGLSKRARVVHGRAALLAAVGAGPGCRGPLPEGGDTVADADREERQADG
ncbi:hypothetical protein GCM10027072_47980 [Streptomyces bullii]